MQQGPVDGIIRIHGGGGKLFFGFLERDQQGMGFDILDMQHAGAFLPGRGQGGWAKCSQDNFPITFSKPPIQEKGDEMLIVSDLYEKIRAGLN